MSSICSWATTWLLATEGLRQRKPHLGQAAESPGSSIGPQGEICPTEPLCWPDHSGQQERQWPLPWLHGILLLSEDQDHKGDKRWNEVGWGLLHHSSSLSPSPSPSTGHFYGRLVLSQVPVCCLWSGQCPWIIGVDSGPPALWGCSGATMGGRRGDRDKKNGYGEEQDNPTLVVSISFTLLGPQLAECKSTGLRLDNSSYLLSSDANNRAEPH